MTVALIALFVALGGSATAATFIITSSSQIKDGAVAKRDLAVGSVNSGRIANGAVRPVDLNGQLRSTLGAEAYEVVRSAGPENVGEGEKATVATMRDIAPGSYAFFAKTTLTSPSQDSGILEPGDALGAHCQLEVEGDLDEARALIGSPGANSPGTLNLQLTRVLGEKGTAKLVCDVSNAPWRASDTSIIALPIPQTPRQIVDG